MDDLFLPSFLLISNLQAAETTEVCLKYTLQGKTFEDKVTFPLQPKPDVK